MRSIAMLAAAAMLTGGGLSLAQDAGEAPEAAAEPGQTPAPQAEAPDKKNTDDIFVPSEEVEADTAVAFPTDI